MNALLNFGKYLYAIPFLLFGFFHFMGANDMAGMVPVPGGAIWVYITGAAMLAAGVAILIGKMDKLAAFLLGVLLLVYVVALHAKGAFAGDQMAMTSMLKDLALAGGAWMYGAYVAKDSSMVG